MTHSKDTRNSLKRLYVEGRSLKSAAQQCEVSYATAQAWKRNAKAQHDDWDVARASYRVSAGGLDAVNMMIIDDFTRLYQSTVATVGNLSDVERVKAVAMLADAYTKFVGATAKAQPKFAKIGIALDTLKMVLEATREHKPHLFEEVIELLDGISQAVQDKYANAS